jgi:hypothetical protein
MEDISETVPRDQMPRLPLKLSLMIARYNRTVNTEKYVQRANGLALWPDSILGATTRPFEKAKTLRSPAKASKIR